MPKAKAEHNIDLQCSLCPKNPRFSDVSHLLTHISSKGHLSHRFKLDIRARNEPQAKSILENFDFWYYSNKLDSLLSDRLAAKNQKKTRKSRVSSVSTSNTSIKQEEDLRSIEPDPPSQGMFRAPVPAMMGWTMPNNTPSTPATGWEASIYSTPNVRRPVPNFGRAETPDNHDDSHVDPSLETPWKPINGPGENEDEKLTDSAKLKGVCWPGMALFDSATPEMRRMRNQKKGGNVLEVMKATSLSVEPSEFVYEGDWDLKNIRYIFGPLSTENSPVKSPTPKRRRAPRKKEPALNDVSVNAPRIQPPRGQRSNNAGQSPYKPSFYQSQGGFPKFSQPPPTLNPLTAALDHRRFHPSAEETEDFKFTFDGVGQHHDDRKKKDIPIFNDPPQVSPGRTESPLDTHGFDLSNPLTTYPSQSMNDHGFSASPTPASKTSAFGLGKENASGQMGHMNQMDMHQMHNQHHQRRAMSASHVYPAQVLYDSSHNPLYNHAYARSFAFSSQFNSMTRGSVDGFGGFGAGNDNYDI